MSVRILERAEPRRIALLTHDGGQSLDVTGPLEVFSIANRIRAARQPAARAPYTLELLAPRAGVVTMSSGLKLIADRSFRSVRGRLDTLIVAGGGVEKALEDKALGRWLQAIGLRVRRLASVCTGAFLLAEAGVLNGRRATTHWAWTEQFSRRYPLVELHPDAIFVRDREISTSAGVTAGIDLALAMVEEDLGHELALAIARQMVVFLKRPGGQSQFSSHLAAQAPAPGILRDLPEWIVANVAADLSVERLATRAAMSPRNFARVFQREMRTTPAKFVEQARVDASRRHLEDSTLSLEEVAALSGFTSAEQMRRTFLRHLRILPQEYRRRFHAARLRAA